MYKIIMSTCAMMLASCKTMDGLKNDVNDIMVRIEPLKIDQFCYAKNHAPVDAYHRYANKTYFINGFLNSVDDNKVKVVSGTGNVFGKLKTPMMNISIGHAVQISGVISAANFDEKFKNTCQILMDDVTVKPLS